MHPTRRLAVAGLSLHLFRAMKLLPCSAVLSLLILQSEAQTGAVGEQRWRPVLSGLSPVVQPGGDERMGAAGAILYFRGTTELGSELWWANTDGAVQPVRDLAPLEASSTPQWIQPLGNGVLFFPATLTPPQLWYTNGSDAGTIRLPAPGALSSGPALQWNGRVYFVTASGAWWSTDGTPEGTTPAPAMLDSTTAAAATVPGGIFYTTDSAEGSRLHFYNGAENRTVHIHAATLGVERVAAAGSRAVFLRRTGENAAEVWASDGTEEGTMSLGVTISGAETWLISGGPLAWFDSLGGDGVSDIWVTDGTAAGTQRVMDGAFETDSPMPRSRVVAAGHRLVFRVEREEAPGQHGRNSVWISDGTVSTTRRVLDSPYAQDAILADAVTGGGHIWFSRTGNDGAGLGFSDLWSLPASAAAPVSVLSQTGLELVPGTLAADTEGNVRILAALGNQVVTGYADAAGTSVDLIPAAVSGGDRVRYPGRLRSTSRGLFFLAESSAGWEPWFTDSPGGSPRLLRDLSTETTYPGTPGPAHSFAVGYTEMDGQVYFFGRNGPASTGAALWRTDGTAAGTVKAAEVSPTESFSLVSLPLALPGSQLVFAHPSPQGGILGYSEAEGLRQLTPGALSAALVRAAVTRGWLTVATSDDGRELWLTDGTPAGTTMVRDIQPGPGSGLPSGSVAPVVAGQRIFFVGDDGVTGRRIWTSLGTEAGTIAISEPSGEAVDSGPESLCVVGDALCYVTRTGIFQGDPFWNLWRIAFTADTTGPPELLASIPMSPSIRALVPDDIFNWFHARQSAAIGGRWCVFLPTRAQGDAVSQLGLWCSDGTAAGTFGNAAFSAPPATTNLFHITPYRGALYFTTNGSFGTGLDPTGVCWRTDGTEEGTWRIQTEYEQIAPREAVEHGGRLYGSDGSQLIVLNHAPDALPAVETAAAAHGTAVTLPFSLLTTGWSDIDGDAPGLRIVAVHSGTLTKAGQPVVPGVTTLTVPESLVWQAPPDASSSIAAFEVAAWDGHLRAASATQVTVTIPALPAAYHAWADASSLAGSARAPLASPAGDGVVNLVKFALGLPAAASAAARLPAILPGPPAGLAITRAPSAATSVNITVEQSENLSDWTPLATDWSTAQSGGPDLERLTLPLTGTSAARYYRLKVQMR